MTRKKTKRRAKPPGRPEATITRVSKIKITAKGFKHWEDEGVGVRRNPATLDAFAKRDGFSDWSALVKWFRAAHGLPFTGIVIHRQNVEVRQAAGRQPEKEHNAGK